MSLFAVLHLWAFPWTEYDVRRSKILPTEYPPGEPLPDESAYKGGAFGHRAFMDSMNPWDLVKAVGRGFRWLAVGRKKREQDISYRKHHLHPANSVRTKPTKPNTEPASTIPGLNVTAYPTTSAQQGLYSPSPSQSNLSTTSYDPRNPFNDEEGQELLTSSVPNSYPPSDAGGDIGNAAPSSYKPPPAGTNPSLGVYPMNPKSARNQRYYNNPHSPRPFDEEQGRRPAAGEESDNEIVGMARPMTVQDTPYRGAPSPSPSPSPYDGRGYAGPPTPEPPGGVNDPRNPFI